MARIEKTVFISYRRTDVYTALAVYENLKNQGYDVFFDYTSISSGDFEQIITSNIRARAHFLIILTPTALDRCSEPGDWLRREIEIAIEEKRNIVPLFFKGFRFGVPTITEKLTGRLKNLSRYNGLNVHEDYFQEAMQRLRAQFLNKPLDTVLHPVSTEVRKAVEKEQVAVDRALEKIENVQELVKKSKEKLARDGEPPKPVATQTVKSEMVPGTPLKAIPWRFIAGITGGILIIALGIWGGINLWSNLPSAAPEPTRTAQPTATRTIKPAITNTPSITQTFILSTAAPSPTQTSNATFTVTPIICPLFDAKLALGGNLARFIADKTIPSGTILLPSQVFEKIWTIQNVGTTTWTTNYTIAFGLGESMGFGVPSPINFPSIIKPGECVDLTIMMVAPTRSGRHMGSWVLLDDKDKRILFDDPQMTTLDIVIVVPISSSTQVSNASAPTPGIGSTMTGKDSMTLLYVPAGGFTMGSNNGESDEKPVHQVYLDAYWIDKTEVTNAMYAKCVQGGDCQPPYSNKSNQRESYYGNPEFDNFPVTWVSWNDAKDYCSWVSRRLPTEAEWEKAASWDAKSQTKYVYPWGNNSPNDGLLNYRSSIGDTTGVGKYPDGASPYGALDMAGNVIEWVADWYDAYQGNTVSDTAYGTNYRVLRGGDWSDNDSEVRSTSRTWSMPYNAKHYAFGFRCAMSATP